MSEWPKRLAMTQDFDDWRHGQHQTVEVISADLGRELYEALKMAAGGLEEAGYDAPLEHEALARYEREVGK